MSVSSELGRPGIIVLVGIGCLTASHITHLLTSADIARSAVEVARSVAEVTAAVEPRECHTDSTWMPDCLLMPESGVIRGAPCVMSSGIDPRSR